MRWATRGRRSRERANSGAGMPIRPSAPSRSWPRPQGVENGGGRGRVALIADTGGIYALYDASDRHHRAVRRAVEAEDGPLVLPAPVLGELDYLLRTRLGVEAELRLLERNGNGALTVEQFTRQDSARCRALLLKYRELDLGLAEV